MLIESLELRCHAHIFGLFMLLYSNTRDAYSFVTMHFTYKYIIVNYTCFVALEQWKLYFGSIEQFQKTIMQTLQCLSGINKHKEQVINIDL